MPIQKSYNFSNCNKLLYYQIMNKKNNNTNIKHISPPSTVRKLFQKVNNIVLINQTSERKSSNKYYYKSNLNLSNLYSNHYQNYREYKNKEPKYKHQSHEIEMVLETKAKKRSVVLPKIDQNYPKKLDRYQTFESIHTYESKQYQSNKLYKPEHQYIRNINPQRYTSIFCQDHMKKVKPKSTFKLKFNKEIRQAHKQKQQQKQQIKLNGNEGWQKQQNENDEQYIEMNNKVNEKM